MWTSIKFFKLLFFIRQLRNKLRHKVEENIGKEYVSQKAWSRMYDLFQLNQKKKNPIKI